MKKILLGSTALLAAATLSMPASAAEKIKLGIGGKLESYFGIVSQDDTATYDPTMTGINTDTEVYFTGATTLDNGLTVGAVIQLEAETDSATNADEQYAYIEGAFGRISAGQKDGVLSQFAHEAPQYGLADDDVAAFFVPANQFGSGIAYFQGVDTTLAGQDNASITYVSPSLAGFTFGATWMPNPQGGLQDNTVASSLATAGQHDQWEAAIAYNGEFAGFAVGADAAYLQSSGDEVIGTTLEAEDASAWRAGLILGYAGFQVGGGYLKQDAVGGIEDNEQTTWNAGVGYKTGPYGVSLVYLNSNGESATDDESDFQQVSLHGAYEMGPGITLGAALFWAEGEFSTAAGVDPESVEGTGGVVGLQLAF
ncbi:porin [Caenispirillum bisanense]|uniref:Outer membrane protein OmpU n=1 Tax=Caenispirillum bisanense TaxID=414052 RepID=A0A286GIL6_9PROT|nr:porin [Caenispirillum bisanense]SOD95066.1 outer membrane protein OmpU [Caenispirillum bisanense]